MLQRSAISRVCSQFASRRYRPLHLKYRQYASSHRDRAREAKDLLLETLATRFPKAYLEKVVQDMPDTKPLDFNAGPMVWIDLEMTGLVPGKDKILEIAVSS